ncbi:MAG: O-antigen ligase family protein [Candidatus Fermentibacteria bacterium]
MTDPLMKTVTDQAELSDNNKVSRITLISLIIIGIVLIVSMFTDHLLIGVLLLGVPGVMFLLAGSPVRVLMAAFAMQIILTLTQLNTVTVGIGILSLRADDLLSIWFVWLWILALPDRSMKGISIGLQGYFTILFLLLFGFSAYRGFTGGNDPFFISFQLKTYGAYFLYFPLLWVLSDEGACRRIWKLLLSSAVIGGFIYMIKGYMGAGDDVFIREMTGVRVVTRQPNAIGVILMMFLGRLWKNWKERPTFFIIIPSIILMGTGVVLSQTRGIWGGIVLALAAAWILNLFRKKDNVRLGRKLIASLTVIAVFIILTVFAISAMGILSASNVAQRTENESGNYLTDTSVLSRLMAWSAILSDLSGSRMITGGGLGAVYTCFRPDIGAVVTVWYVDGAFFQIALNMGITGVVVFLGVFIVTLVRAAKLFIRTKSRRRAGIALGIFCAVILLIFASGFASVLTNYRFTMLWVFLPALLQSEIIRERKENALLPAG